MICVSLVENKVSSALSACERAAEVADLIEIRLDALEEPQVAPFFRVTEKPLLFTCRAREEGGFREFPLPERLSFLKEAARLGAYAVDLELACGQEAIEELKKDLGKTRLILSYHNFSGTPEEDELRQRAEEMKASGARWGKIVTTARRPEEALVTLSLIPWARRKLKFPLIAFAMGEAGKFSRAVCLLLGAPLTYASLPRSCRAAPGQIPADQLREVLEILS